MKLTSLSIALQGYGVNSGKYTGDINFENQYGSVKIVLDPEISEKVLKLCGEALVTQASKTAGLLANNIIEQVPALESK